MVNVITWGIILFGVVLVIYLFIVFRNRLQEQQMRERMAEAEFEASILGSMSSQTSSFDPFSDNTPIPSASAPANIPLQSIYSTQETTPTPEVDVTGIATYQSQLNSIGDGDPLTTTIDAGTVSSDPNQQARMQDRIISALRAANLLDDIEGYMELNGDARAGVILRMRNKNRILLLTYFETEVFSMRNLKRFDKIIYMDRHGKAALLTSFENYIADSFSGHMR